jgi:hypothetical protein
MRPQFGLRLAAGSASAVAVVVLAAAPALSDPAAGVRPRPADVVGVGSGTTEYLMDQLAARYDGAHPTGPRIYSYDAPAGSSTTGPRITPKSGCRPISRPDGDAAGIEALANGAGGSTGGHPCLDFARSWGGAVPDNLTHVSFVPLALDNVTYASISHGSNAPPNLTAADLTKIYSCAVTRWNQVGGTSDATIRPLLPQLNSGSVAFSFLSAIDLLSPGSCVSSPATLTENEGVSPSFTGPGAANEIVPFSAGRWLAQAYRSPACFYQSCRASQGGVLIRCKTPARGQNAFGCDVNGDLKLNDINGLSAITGSGRGTVLNPRFAPAFVRTLYDVVRGTDRIPAYLQPFFGPKGAFCSKAYQSVIIDYGFEPARDCGTLPYWIIHTVAGDGGIFWNGNGIPATRAEVPYPGAVAVDGAGNLLVTNGFNRVQLVAARTAEFYGQAMKAGDIYTVAGDGKSGYNGDGIPATRAEVNGPAAVAVDGSGNLVIADNGDSRVRVVAVGNGTFYGQAMKAGDIYTVAGDGDVGYNGDGIPAGTAELNSPEGVAVDGAGNLVIADTNNSRVRVVAVRNGMFYGQAMKAGDIYTVAGDGTSGYNGDGIPATRAGVVPNDVAVDGHGNLVITDLGGRRVRVVAVRTGTFYGQAMKAGDIYTVAGNGAGQNYGGNGIPATSAAIQDPGSVAVDHAGNLLFTDQVTSLVRVVAASTGTFYGIPMTAGYVYTIAGIGDGNSGSGYNGDGIPAYMAELNSPEGVTVDGAGNVLIADLFNNRVRMVSP